MNPCRTNFVAAPRFFLGGPQNSSYAKLSIRMLSIHRPVRVSSMADVKLLENLNIAGGYLPDVDALFMAFQHFRPLAFPD